MKLSDVVAGHGFRPSELGSIANAKLYERHNNDGMVELLCVQKIGKVMRVDRQPLLALSNEDPETTPMLLPIGTGITNQIVPQERLEDYLNTTLAA
ncbi:hypothetical protein KR52_08260 [Synechococcus sp. KORDI-52]|uniref:hypothetical protein n=1 Tax=Synechococcus sp. KORDI-52 TaxID=585425 RepID=UPI0004E03831|nr:hypothetical protein [Synechococcus sp. KORDI-52]AII49133.1 hypothetical protein KR52_08260 [Synechococcus sp. KORDI-52]